MTTSTDLPLEWDELDFYDRLAIKMRSEKSFLNFTRIWFELIQGEKLLVNWHHRLIAKEIDEVVRGGHSSRNLVICLPPGGTKTEFLSIHLPAYTNMLVNIGELDRFRNLNLSFADSLVKRNSKRTRDIISSPEYQELWPCSFGTNQAEEWQIVNSNGKVKGETVSRAMGGQITGGRAGYYGPKFSGSVNLDDPAKPEDMFSAVKREATNRKLNGTVRSRRGDKSKEHPTPFFVIMQRLHPEDPAGFCLSGGMGVKFKEIKIPALIDRDYLDSLPDDVSEMCWRDISKGPSRTINGKEYWSYWPEMEDVDQLVELWERDEYTFLSQYQQAPKNASGGLIDTDWLGRYETIPYLETVGVYVDTNSGKITDRNDYTVFLLAGRGNDGNLYILDVRRDKWDPTGLLATAKALWNEWRNAIPDNYRIKPRHMNIEDKQAGQGLIQELKGNSGIIVNPVQRGTNQNKWARHCNVQPHIKTGKVFVPLRHDDEGVKITQSKWMDGSTAFSTEWVMEYLQELDAVTFGVLMDQESGYDDQYDATMDAIDCELIHEKSALTSLADMYRRRA